MTGVKLVLAAGLIATSFTGILAAVAKDRVNAPHGMSKVPQPKGVRRATGKAVVVDSSALAANIQKEKDLLAGLMKSLDNYKAISIEAERAFTAKEKADNHTAAAEIRMSAAITAVEEAKKARVEEAKNDWKSNPYDAIKSSNKDFALTEKNVAAATAKLSAASKLSELAMASAAKAAEAAESMSEEKAQIAEEMAAQRREAKQIARDISKVQAQQKREEVKVAKATAEKELQRAELLADAAEVAHEVTRSISGGKRQQGKRSAPVKGDTSKGK